MKLLSPLNITNNFTVDASGNVVIAGTSQISGNETLGSAITNNHIINGTVTGGGQVLGSTGRALVVKPGTIDQYGDYINLMLLDNGGLESICFQGYNSYFGTPLIQFSKGTGGFDFLNYRAILNSGLYDYKITSQNGTGNGSLDRVKITGAAAIAPINFLNTAVGISLGSLFTPTAALHIAPASSAYASLRLEATAAAPTAPNNGDMWHISNHLYVQLNGSTVQLDGQGTSSAPAGSNTQIQFNNSGVLAGSSGLTWITGTNTFSLAGSNTGVELTGITAEPSAPATSVLRLYSKSIAGRMFLKAKGPSGLDYPYQAAFWQNNILIWQPTTATAGLWLCTVGAGAGTYTTALPTTTNVYTSTKRARYANVITTTNQVLGQRNTEAMFFRGSTSPQGGFFFYTRCGFDTWTNGSRFFAGMATATTVVSADPSALANTVGFCVDAADNGLISFLTRDATTATKQSTGLTITSNGGYDLYIFCKSNDTKIGYRIVDLNTSTEFTGSATANLPVNTTLLTANVLASNAALTAATATNLGINKIYIETDY